MFACTLATLAEVCTVPVTTWPPVTTDELKNTPNIFGEPVWEFAGSSVVGEGVGGAGAAGVCGTDVLPAARAVSGVTWDFGGSD